jgi:hypothetical protein
MATTKTFKKMCASMEALERVAIKLKQNTAQLKEEVGKLNKNLDKLENDDTQCPDDERRVVQKRKGKPPLLPSPPYIQLLTISFFLQLQILSPQMKPHGHSSRKFAQ